MMFRKWIIPVALIFIITTACTGLAQFALPPIALPTEEVAVVATPPEPGLLIPKVLASYPHDSNAFTQGFLLYEGRLFESTGLNGQSSLREVNPETGEVLRQIDLSQEYFAEGLALVDNRLIQLTWKNGIAFVYDRDTFQQIGSYTYDTEGWGLCYDGTDLYMSDGSSLLYVRDPQTFEIERTVQVLYQGQPITQLNELECVDDSVYANVWLTDVIVQIDKQTGDVRNYIYADGLLTPEEEAKLGSGATLNGIAYNEATGRFLLTGKLFPKMWEVTWLGTR
jgi:glutamine cyclotransferase